MVVGGVVEVEGNGSRRGVAVDGEDGEGSTIVLVATHREEEHRRNVTTDLTL